MAQCNRPTENSSENSTPVDDSVPVSLTLAQWNDVLAMIEVGVKAIGVPAFIMGGALIEQIQRQLATRN